MATNKRHVFLPAVLYGFDEDDLNADDKLTALTLYLMTRNDFVCPYCHQKLSNYHNIVYHWEHKPYTCDNCYYSIGNLIRHKKLIHRER